MKDTNINPVRLTRRLFEDTDVVSTARSLLGKVLCTHFSGKLTTGLIVETEAYRAPEDKASHAYHHRRTSRTEVMFGPPGHAYVYLCYGIHHLFNIVTGPVDTAHAILIRAIEPVVGIDHMLARRNMAKLNYRITAGPGSLSRALGLERKHSGLDLTSADSSIWIEHQSATSMKQKKLEAHDIIASPRVGVDYSEECASWPWRFRIKDNPWVSLAK